MSIKRAKLNKRQSAIQELIKTHAIEDQAMLLELLSSQYGIATNQAAISRDLRSLGVIKKLRGNSMIYEFPTVDVITEILHYAVRSIRHNETLIIINTVPGTADFVGDFLDAQDDLNILGTLAGENVVFVAPNSVKDISVLVQKLSQRIKLKEM